MGMVSSAYFWRINRQRNSRIFGIQKSPRGDKRKMDISELEIARVVWRDAQESDGKWTPIEEIERHDTAICCDVGYLITCNDEKVIVMRSAIFEEGKVIEGGAHIAIPKDWVQSIEILESTGEIK